MAFEVFDRTTKKPSGKPTISISKLGRLSLHRATTEILQANAAKAALLLWDRVDLKIGIQPISPTDNRAYDITYVEKDINAFMSAKRFLDWIGYDYSTTRTFDAVWNEKTGVFEIDIPLEHIDKDKRPLSQRPMTVKKRHDSLKGR
jgi:hypothetical protein